MWGRKVIVVAVVLLSLLNVAFASSDAVNNNNNNVDIVADDAAVSPKALPEFDWVRLRKYLFYSWACYAPNPQLISNWTCCWCNATVPHVTVTHIAEGDGFQGAFGFVGFNTENEIIVSFRGAATIENLIVFEFWEDVYPYVKGATVEHGFWTLWKTIQKQIITEVQALQAKFPTYNVITMGHSLGGSLSILSAIDLVRAGVKNVQVFNYGQPRVGNPTFAKYAFETIPSIIRVTNHKDIAPQIPPRFVGGYTHSSTEVWFGIPGDFKNYTICSQTNGEDPKCSNSVPLLELTKTDHMTYLGYENASC